MKRIVLFGACCSRDAFNSKFIPEWRDEFILELYRFQPSIISLVSQPIFYKQSELGEVETRDFGSNMLANELEKNYLDELISIAPSAILIDFYSDVVNGVIQVNNSYIVNRIQNWKRTKVFLELNKKEYLTPCSDYEKYMYLWNASYDKFIDIIHRNLPHTLIFVNSCRLTDVYEENGSIKKYLRSPALPIKRMNEIWEEMDVYAEKKGARRIVYQKEYMLDPNYIYGGLFYVHYEKKYFREFFENAKKIIPDVMDDTEYKHHNLICNGSFKYYKFFYRYWDSLFKVSGDVCVFSNYENDHVRNPQIWSNLIANPAGVHHYIFSFKCRIKDPSLMTETKMIAAIRTYDKRNALQFKNCKKEYKIYPSEKQLKSNEWEIIRYEFDVKEKYFSCGLAVTCRGYIEYKDLSCYRRDCNNYDSFENRLSVVEAELLNDVEWEHQ